MERKIYLDMDGTWVNLYGVEGWLNDLINYNPRPYAEAKPLVHLATLARTIHELQRAGWAVCIISWLSKNSTVDYDMEVKNAKLAWLANHIPSVEWDEIHIIEYGTPKYTCGNGILFDDEERNRNEWKGIAYSEENLIKNLRDLIHF
jgi:hypothetical protein